MPTRPLTDDLFDPATAGEFDFFQAVRLLEAVLAETLPPTPDPVDRLGGAVRVRAHPALTFPTSSVARVARPGVWDGEPPGGPAVPTVSVTFFGLTGPTGTLPTGYTELVGRVRTAGDPTTGERTALRDWLDLFTHRLAVLLYAGWEKYRFPVRFARAARLPGAAPDPFTRAVLGLVGLGTPGVRGRLRVDPPAAPPGDRPPPLARVNDLALLHYAGLIARRVPTAVGLEVLVADYFGVGARVEELTGQWLTLSPAATTRLDPDAQNRLGENTLAGERVWDPSSRFRVVLGPLRYAAFVEFLPDPSPVPARKGFFLLSQVIRLYAGPEFDFDVRLDLFGPDVPDCVLREVDPDELGVRLGWNTWLFDVPPARVVDDVCLDGDPRTAAG